MQLHAAIQTICLLIAIFRCPQRYGFFLLSMLASLPLIWFPAEIGIGTHWPQDTWERVIWLPSMLAMIPFQALSCLQAVFRFGERYPLVSRLCVALGVFGTAGIMAVWVWPHGGKVEQVAQAAKYEMVGGFIVVVGAVLVYSSLNWRAMVGRPEGAHLVLLCLWMFTWVARSLMPVPPTWQEWLGSSWSVTMRTWVAVAWVLMVALRRQSDLQLIHAVQK